MIPLILVIVAVAVLLAGGAAVAVAIFGSDAKRAHVTLLGPRRVGKTTLGTYLETGKITKAYYETRTAERFDGDIDMGDLELQVRMCSPGGSEDQYRDWLDLAKSAKVIVYMFDVVRLRKDKAHAKQVREGAQQVRLMKTAGDLNKHVRIVVVGTHRDQDTNPGSPSYEAKLAAHPDVVELTRILQPHQTLFVSLHSNKEIEEVLWAVGQEAGK